MTGKSLNNGVPWWNGYAVTNLGGNICEFDQFGHALVQQSLKAFYDAPTYDAGLNGALLGSFEELVSKLRALDLRLVYRTPVWEAKDSEKVVLVGNDSVVEVCDNNGDGYGRIATTNKEHLDAVHAIFKEHFGPRSSKGRVYTLYVASSGSLSMRSMGVASVPLERGNYNPGVLEDYDHVVSDLKSQDPTGRLAIFDGNPGSGKSYMIRGLMNDVDDAIFLIVPAGLIAELSGPSMIGTLMNAKSSSKGPMILIVEDADNTLAKRDAGNVNSVSALLNLGDGLVGAMLDIRVVCTTNLKDAEMDEAVLRPGRLSRKIHVGPLDPAVAEEAYFRISGNRTRIRESMTIAQVYSMAKDKGWKPPVKPRAAVGFGRYAVDLGDE